MSSLPPNSSKTNSASLLNRFAKRDPQLYPLAAIMLGITGVAGYFLATKWSNAPEPANHWTQGLDQDSKYIPAGKRAEEWKDKYRRVAAEREQHMADSMKK